jgi:hypothetical protein
VRDVVYGYNCQVHATTGLSPFELALSRPPAVPILEARPVQSDGKSKPEFRSTFLTQLSRLASTTKKELAAQQQCYKDVYDAHAWVRNKDIEAGDLVFVRTFAEAPGLPKLRFPSAGPYVVEACNERIFRVGAPLGIVQVYSDRGPITATRGPSRERTVPGAG